MTVRPVRVATVLALAGAVLVPAATLTAPHASAQAQPATVTEMPRAKNVIMLIGDGMGYQHTDMASLYQYGTTYRQIVRDPATGATRHVDGTPSQVFQKFPVQTWMSSWSLSTPGKYDAKAAWGDFDWVKDGATDSAAAGTALATGVKTQNGVLGLDGQGRPVRNLVEVAESAGKASGVVSSVPFSHATPSAYVVHTESRNDYHEIARQMIHSSAEVIMGAGHPGYTEDHTKRPSSYDWISQEDYSALTSGQTSYTYLEGQRAFERLAAATPDSGMATAPKVFGLAQTASTLQANRSGAKDGVAPYSVRRNDVPALSTMATGALNVLNKDRDGFFLMVEGGAIDWTSHGNDETRTIEETVDFNRAVEATVRWVEKYSSWDETLVVVTADHETGYLAGPGADPRWTQMTGLRGRIPKHSWQSGSHTNQLVPLYAKGPGAYGLKARADQTDPVRGSYLDNVEVARVQRNLMER